LQPANLHLRQMNTANQGYRYLFHVYLPTQRSIACNTSDRVRAVVRADAAHRLDVAAICPNCLRAIKTGGKQGLVATAPWLVRSALAGKA
jgi:hypothetical protein